MGAAYAWDWWPAALLPALETLSPSGGFCLLFPVSLLLLKVKMLSILRGLGGKDLRGCLFKFSVPCCSDPFLQRSGEQWVAPGWPVQGCPGPCGHQGEPATSAPGRGSFYWPVRAFSGQVSSLRACWQPFDNRDKVIIVLKRSLKENFWKVLPDILCLWLIGSIRVSSKWLTALTGSASLPSGADGHWWADEGNRHRARHSHCCGVILFLFFERREPLWKRGPAFGESDFELWFFTHWETLYSMLFNIFEVHFHYLWNGAIYIIWGDREDMGLRDIRLGFKSCLET